MSEKDSRPNIHIYLRGKNVPRTEVLKLLDPELANIHIHLEEAVAFSKVWYDHGRSPSPPLYDAYINELFRRLQEASTIQTKKEIQRSLYWIPY